MGFLNEIELHNRKEFCQNGETGLLEFIFKNIGVTNKYAVEFGAGNGYNMSNIRYFIKQGWSALQMDCNNKGNSEVKTEFITKDNIVELFVKYNVPNIFDLLSIDLDGNDYWILNELLKKYIPRVVILEYNSAKDGSITIEYNENHKWDYDEYFGASFEAFKKLMSLFNYDLVFNNINVNLIFIKNEIIKNEEKPIIINNIKHYHPEQKGQGKWVEV